MGLGDVRSALNPVECVSCCAWPQLDMVWLCNLKPKREYVVHTRAGYREVWALWTRGWVNGPGGAGGGGGGGRKNSPQHAKFQPSRGETSVAVGGKKTPQVEKVPGFRGVSRIIGSVETMHVSGAQLMAPE